MPDVHEALAQIAASRRADPLAPVTVIAPSHAAALQLRRRLAAAGPFAGVRFETLPRIAELLGAGHLAAAGRSPLARPIGDYVAEQVARESRGVLERVGDLPGYARVLRQIFRRLRRGGIHSAAEVQGGPYAGHMPELLRLYDRFRAETAKFYDDEDLLEEAANAVRENRAGALADLGAIYILPPGALTAAGTVLLDALKSASPAFVELEERAARSNARFVLAPDPASEAREAARDVIEALESGLALDEVAVFHGADDAYPRLLREAFTAAGLPAVPVPGVPLTETPAGRGVLALGRLPEREFSRTAVMDALSAAPTPEWLPGKTERHRVLTTIWDKISRDAGITHGADTWAERLQSLMADREAAIRSHEASDDDVRARIATYERDHAGRLLDVIEGLIDRLQPLQRPQPAREFIETFTGIVKDYVADQAPGDVEYSKILRRQLESVTKEIEQLGTVDKLPGSTFTLPAFMQALNANLDAAYDRPESLGNGIVVADYRAAAGLRFRRVILCGCYEGVFPAGAGVDALADDRTWRTLREHHPFVEDAELRRRRAEEAADRAKAAAGDGDLIWSAPLYESGGTREYYPAPMMVAAASEKSGRALTSTELRREASTDGWLRRGESPLAFAARGPVLERGELGIRDAVLIRKDGRRIDDLHPAARPVAMLRARRSDAFTEWDGNLSSLADSDWLELQKAVSPTSLEHYATCGYRYFSRSLLRLSVVEEPEERDVMDAGARGTLVHTVLETFFRRQKERGRPAVGEPWVESDLDELVGIMKAELEESRRRGQMGLAIFSGHEERTLRADLGRFLEEDSAFRRETGAVPDAFEAEIPVVEIAGVKLRGRVDRIDRTPDGRQAWVIDYKTGSTWSFKDMEKQPLGGGTHLQLPTYLHAVADADQAVGLYWFISRKGEFKRVAYEPSPERDQRFHAAMEAIVSGIRRGAFPAISSDEDEYRGGFQNCTYCDFDRICSRRRDFEQAAKATQPGVAPWRAVGEAAQEPEEFR